MWDGKRKPMTDEQREQWRVYTALFATTERKNARRSWSVWPIADFLMAAFVIALIIAGFIMMLAGCVHLPHTQPELRAPTRAAASVVRLDYSCSDDMQAWSMGHATGFVVDDRTVITAAHVVRCMVNPVVTATTYDGRRFAMVVSKDQATFGDGRDVATLHMASGSTFGLRIGPPVFAEPSPRDAIRVYTLHGEIFGTIIDGHGECELENNGFAGDSGAPVLLTNGAIVGVIVAGHDEFKSKLVRFDRITDKDR